MDSAASGPGSALENRVRALELALEGHRHNSFSGEFWLPWPVSDQVAEAKEAESNG